ncbi:MAG: hypothetical protein JJU06_03265 [Ectothiorhodospiraceae bacterium]|nr:hypothetical protein [Ectothiorhodospiraceae bacterium]MCH8502933.1 hypothetical protein [Ectothiorhodospiraceae bacterium]
MTQDDTATIKKNDVVIMSGARARVTPDNSKGTKGFRIVIDDPKGDLLPAARDDGFVHVELSDGRQGYFMITTYTESAATLKSSGKFA